MSISCPKHEAISKFNGVKKLLQLNILLSLKRSFEDFSEELKSN